MGRKQLRRTKPPAVRQGRTRLLSTEQFCCVIWRGEVSAPLQLPSSLVDRSEEERKGKERKRGRRRRRLQGEERLFDGMSEGGSEMPLGLGSADPTRTKECAERGGGRRGAQRGRERPDPTRPARSLARGPRTHPALQVWRAPGPSRDSDGTRFFRDV